MKIISLIIFMLIVPFQYGLLDDTPTPEPTLPIFINTPVGVTQVPGCPPLGTLVPGGEGLTIDYRERCATCIPELVKSTSMLPTVPIGEIVEGTWITSTPQPDITETPTPLVTVTNTGVPQTPYGAYLVDILPYVYTDVFGYNAIVSHGASNHCNIPQDYVGSIVNRGSGFLSADCDYRSDLPSGWVKKDNPGDAYNVHEELLSIGFEVSYQWELYASDCNAWRSGPAYIQAFDVCVGAGGGPTPTITPTNENTLYCGVPEYAQDVDYWVTDLSINFGACYTIVPELDIELPDLLGLTQDITLTGWQVCTGIVDLPVITIAGIQITSEWLGVVGLALVLWWLVRL